MSYIILLAIEVLTVIVLKENFRKRSPRIFILSLLINFILSIWFWTVLYRVWSYNSFYDNPEHIWLLMNLSGLNCAVVFPRIVIILFHFIGKLIRIGKGGYIRWLSLTGIVGAVSVSLILGISTFYTRFNFITENVEIKVKGLHKDLEGLRIVQLSDMHLATFHKHGKLLVKAMEKVNSLKPDLLINTGDFITFGWREFESNDTILSKAKARYGRYTIMGNHDWGAYQPFYTEADRNDNVLIVNNLMRSSGYTVLKDTNTIVNIKDARLGLIGITTKGRFPHIIHGDMRKALSGLDSADLKILLSHDPNQWEEDVVSRSDVDITLSGHTHAMQMGIYTKIFRWSPAKFIYPHWGGLYSEGKQQQYVNRGLGVLAVPFRIWMPPEITLITLRKE